MPCVFAVDSKQSHSQPSPKVGEQTFVRSTTNSHFPPDVWTGDVCYVAGSGSPSVTTAIVAQRTKLPFVIICEKTSLQPKAVTTISRMGGKRTFASLAGPSNRSQVSIRSVEGGSGIFVSKKSRKKLIAFITEPSCLRRLVQQGNRPSRKYSHPSHLGKKQVCLRESSKAMC